MQSMSKKNSLDCFTYRAEITHEGDRTLASFTDAELQVELDARAKNAIAKTRAEAKAKAEARLAKFLKKLNMDWIDILAPDHTMTRCSDDDPINAFEVYCTGLRRCRRCALIEISSGRHTNEDAEAFLQSIGFF